jgi:hypothetical protein
LAQSGAEASDGDGHASGYRNRHFNLGISAHGGTFGGC